MALNTTARTLAVPGQARGADKYHARTHLGWSPCFPSWRQGFHAMRSGSPVSEASR